MHTLFWKKTTFLLTTFLNFRDLQRSLKISSQPLSMFRYCVCAVRSHHKKRNNFIELVAVEECYLIITYVKNKESKKQSFRICLPVKLADGRMSIKKEKVYSYLIYNVHSNNNNNDNNNNNNNDNIKNQRSSRSEYAFL